MMETSLKIPITGIYSNFWKKWAEFQSGISDQ